MVMDGVVVLLLLSFIPSMLMAVQRKTKYFLAYSWITYVLLVLLACCKSQTFEVLAASATSLGFLSVFSFLINKCSRDLGEKVEDLRGLASLSSPTAWILAISCYALSMLPPFAPFLLEHYLIEAMNNAYGIIILELLRIMLLYGFAKMAVNVLLKTKREVEFSTKFSITYALVVVLLVIVSLLLFIGVKGDA